MNRKSMVSTFKETYQCVCPKVPRADISVFATGFGLETAKLVLVQVLLIFYYLPEVGVKGFTINLRRKPENGALW